MMEIHKLPEELSLLHLYLLLADPELSLNLLQVDFRVGVVLVGVCVVFEEVGDFVLTVCCILEPASSDPNSNRLK